MLGAGPVQVLEQRESAEALVLRSVRGADAVMAGLHHMPAALGLSRRGRDLQYEVAMAIATPKPVRRPAWAPDASAARMVACDLIQETGPSVS